MTFCKISLLRGPGSETPKPTGASCAIATSEYRIRERAVKHFQVRPCNSRLLNSRKISPVFSPEYQHMQQLSAEKVEKLLRQPLARRAILCVFARLSKRCANHA